MDIAGEIHRILSNTIWLFFLILGVWGLFRAIRSNNVNGSYLGALVVGEGLYILQAILGIILILGDAQPGRTIHYLYGAFAIVALPGLFAFLRGDDSNRAQWSYALATLFLFGISLRAIGTGTGS